MQRCRDDTSFGPLLQNDPGCYSFDFTLLFEDCVLNLLPSSLIVLAALWRGWAIRHKPNVMKPSKIKALKIFVFLILLVLQACIIALPLTRDRTHLRTRGTLPGNVINLVSVLFLTALSTMEHGRTVSPSHVVQASILLMLVLDAPRIRTQWLLDETRILAAMMSATLLPKFILLLLESLDKTHLFMTERCTISPKETCGMFGSGLVLWLLPLLATGYKRELVMKDVLPLESDMDAALLGERLTTRWNKSTLNKRRNYALGLVLLSTFLPEILIAWVPRAASIGLTLTQPILVRTTLQYFRSHDNLPSDYGYGLLGAFGLVFVGLAIANVTFFLQVAKTTTKIRGALISLIYHHMMALRSDSHNSQSAVALMSTDVDTIVLTTRWVIDIIPNVVQIGVAMWILNQYLGAVCVAPIVVALLCAVAGGWLGKLMPPLQSAWMGAAQTRVNFTTNLLGNVKSVKMTGLVDPAGNRVQELRDIELSKSARIRKVQVGNAIMNSVPVVSMQAVTFITFAIISEISGSGSLGVVSSFTSVSLLQTLTTPVITLITSVPRVCSATACLNRIRDFLLLEKLVEYRRDMRPTTHYTCPKKQDGSFPDSDGHNVASTSTLISADEASFAWHGESEKPVLTDITFQVQLGSLTIVSGPMASGKTTLLKGLLGEARLVSGSVHFANVRNVAYCDQHPWVLNLSIKDNIVGCSQYSELRYKETIHACQLIEDLQSLTEGDETVIGSQGTTLSGGQKVRVALARAVYSRKQIVILDDVLRGLDARTASACFAALLHPGGILRKSGIAVIMTTQDEQYFRHADQLLFLDSSGRMVRKSLNPSERKLAHDVSSVSTLESDEKNDLLVNPTSEYRVSTSSSGHSSEPVHVPGSAKHERSLLYYVRSMKKKFFVLFMVLVVLNIVCFAIQPLWLKFWASANETNKFEEQGKWIGIYCLLCILNLGFMSSQFWLYLLRLVPDSGRALHWRVLQSIMRAPVSYFVATDVGKIINRCSQDMALIDLPLPMAFMMALEQTVQAMVELILTCVSSGYMAISIIPVAAALFVIQRVYLRTSRTLRLLDLERKSPLYSSFISSWAGLTTIRAFSWASECIDSHTKLLNLSQQAYYLFLCIQRWLTLVLDLVLAGLCLLLVGLSIALRDRIDVGLLGVAITSLVGFGASMNQMIQFWTDLEISLGAVVRIREFANDTPREEGLDASQHQSPPCDWPAKGEISINRLSFRYNHIPVLQGINMAIRAGEKVAVCGRSGSGKSTLLALLLRLYEPGCGTIFIDGNDITSISTQRLRESLITLPQDSFFFMGTVRFNLDPASVSSDEEILEALKKTGLRDLVIEKGGLEAEFHEQWLSAGQRQMFCLARAMLRRCRILILDEPTSGLDSETEACVERLIRQEFANCTVLAVVHRLQTIIDFDKVAVLQNSELVEFDAPRRLLETGGLFRTLWDLQHGRAFVDV